MAIRSPIRKLAGSLSHTVARFPRLHGTLRKLFLRIPKSLRGAVIVHDSFDKLAHHKNDVFFIQIGANDGDQNDPLRHFVDSKKSGRCLHHVG